MPKGSSSDSCTGDTHSVAIHAHWDESLNATTDAELINGWQVRSSVDDSFQSANGMQPTHSTSRTDLLYDFPQDVTEGDPLSWPVYLYVPDGLHRTIKGRLIDLQFQFGQFNEGAMQPAASPFERTIFGRFWIPADTPPVF